MAKSIKLKGVRTNNLKNIDVEFPINKITCVSGVSGSGKSSLVFNTLANESKRRFLNSMPSSMNFFERVPTSAEVDLIEPVLPVWSLAQNNPIVGSRLNLADQLEISYELAQLYFDQQSSKCLIHNEEFIDGLDLAIREIKSIISDKTKVLHILIGKDHYQECISGMPARSFNSNEQLIREFNEEDAQWEIFRLKPNKISNFKKKWLELIKNSAVMQLSVYFTGDDQLHHFSLNAKEFCQKCDEEGLQSARQISDLLPYNGIGACTECKGYGSTLSYDVNKIVKYPKKKIKDSAITFLDYSKYSAYYKTFITEMKKLGVSDNERYCDVSDQVEDLLLNGGGRFYGVLNFLYALEEKRYKRSARIFLRKMQSEKVCHICYGRRLSQSAMAHCGQVENISTYGDLLSLTVEGLLIELKHLNENNIIKKVKDKLAVAVELGLGDFPLMTKLKSLETSEYQKSLLVRYLSFKGSGSLFVLDEPSLGMTIEEQKVLLKYLKNLSKNNTVVMVEHSTYLQNGSDKTIHIGPGAGHLGGEVVEIKGKSKKQKELVLKKTKPSGKLTFKDIEFEDKKYKKIEFKLGTINQVLTNVESFDKRLIINALFNELNEELFKEKYNFETDYEIGSIDITNEVQDIHIYETRIEKSTSRSTVGTTLDLTGNVRNYFTKLPVSKSLGLEKGHFSKNSKLGQCSVCEGKGVQEIDMQYLEDVSFPCDECGGTGLKKFYASITDGKYTIIEASETPVSTLFETIPATPKIKRTLGYLKLLNLDYLTLDRTIPSLSGGERLRVKLLKAIDKKVSDSIIVLTNISYGLSMNELTSICELLQGLTDQGNTLIILDNHEIFSNFNQIKLD
ncbi:hypothetical protein [Halobacteriovorax sp.]|uniref:hypothetical protein n=1 Tax=Halobacteriovorax sp. TaxID=2020862 RepID=UPI003AF23681